MRGFFMIQNKTIQMQKQKMRIIQRTTWVSTPAESNHALLCGNGMHPAITRSNDDIQRPWHLRMHT
jgi:hypothetical protein